MGKARDLARLSPNSSGLLPNANIEAVAASKLTGQVPDANAPSGSVLQVVTATKTNATLCNASANTWNEHDSNFRIQFTPLSASSKFLLFMHISGGSLTGCPRMRFEFSTNGGSSWSLCSPIGDARSNRTQSHCSIPIHSDGNVMAGTSAEILFSPNTTSTIIIRVMFGADQPNFLAWNFSRNDNDNFLGNTMVSTLRAMEIAQ
jgi:hypothetical protein